MYEVVHLDSDEDEGTQRPSAVVSIFNTRPLDLSSALTGSNQPNQAAASQSSASKMNFSAEQSHLRNALGRMSGNTMQQQRPSAAPRMQQRQNTNRNRQNHVQQQQQQQQQQQPRQVQRVITRAQTCMAIRTETPAASGGGGGSPPTARYKPYHSIAGTYQERRITATRSGNSNPTQPNTNSLPAQPAVQLRQISPPRTHPAGLEVDWRMRLDGTNISHMVAPADQHVSDERLKNHHFHAIGPTDPDEFKRDKLPWLKFKCTFGGCSLIITGDYHFVCHLWAHVVSFKVDPEDGNCEDAIPQPRMRGYQKNRMPYTDVDKLSRCPECLVRFHFPMQMQVHFTRVHSRVPQALKHATCTICERDVGGGAEGLRRHLTIHSSRDAPYNCRLCMFRTTRRDHLFDHYCRAHGNTGTLMCPFCMYTHVIPSHKLGRSLYIMSNFVDHMKSHAEKIRIRCDLCSCCFLDEASLRNHKVDHALIPSDWQIFEQTPEWQVVRSDLKKKEVYCQECRNLPSSLLRRNEQCPECTERKFWARIKKREAKQGAVVEESVGCSIPPPGTTFRCSCGLMTTQAMKLIRHVDATNHHFEVLEKHEGIPPRAPTPFMNISEAERKEAEMFAVLIRDDPIEKAKLNMARGKYLWEHGDGARFVNDFNLCDDPRVDDDEVIEESLTEALVFSSILENDVDFSVEQKLLDELMASQDDWEESFRDTTTPVEEAMDSEHEVERDDNGECEENDEEISKEAEARYKRNNLMPNYHRRMPICPRAITGVEMESEESSEDGQEDEEMEEEEDQVEDEDQQEEEGEDEEQEVEDEIVVEEDQMDEPILPLTPDSDDYNGSDFQEEVAVANYANNGRDDGSESSSSQF